MLRENRKLTNAVMNDDFNALELASGRPSIAPEYVLGALWMQAFYSVS